MEKNENIIKAMINLSRIVKKIKEARANLSSASDYTRFFIIKGEVADSLTSKLTHNVHDCLYVEQHLRKTISDSCCYLSGFDANKMDPIDYISTHDIQTKYADLCKNRKIVASINLITGEIIPINAAEEKCPVEKS